jgi:hypothetical protein
VAVLVFLSSIPFSCGAVIALGPSKPEFTVNICSPIQIFGQVSSTSLAHSATNNAPSFNPLCTGPLAPNLATPVVELNVTPETPPPEPLV